MENCTLYKIPAWKYTSLHRCIIVPRYFVQVNPIDNINSIFVDLQWIQPGSRKIHLTINRTLILDLKNMRFSHPLSFKFIIYHYKCIYYTSTRIQYSYNMVLYTSQHRMFKSVRREGVFWLQFQIKHLINLSRIYTSNIFQACICIPFCKGTRCDII